MKMTVHKFQSYSIASDEIIVSRRYGTADAIKEICAQIVPNTQIEIDSEDLDPTMEGMTPTEYVPVSERAVSPGGFQTRVK